VLVLTNPFSGDQSMFNPKEAAEDSHALNLAILFFAGFACLVAVYFHYDSGLKYWLLRYFGEETPATVLSVQEANGEKLTLQQALHKSPRETLKNSTHYFTHGTIFVEIITPSNTFQVLSFRVPEEWLADLENDRLSVTFLTSNPKIAHPTDLLGNFSFDGRLLVWSLIGTLVILFLAVRSARKWSNFRNGLRRY